MKIAGLPAILIGVYLLRVTYLTYRDYPDIVTAAAAEDAPMNAAAANAVKAHLEEEHQRRTVFRIEGMAGGVFLLGGLAMVTIRR
jgi:hypothetical protein